MSSDIFSSKPDFSHLSKIKITDATTSREWARSVKKSDGNLSGGDGLALSRDEAEQLYGFLRAGCQNVWEIRRGKEKLTGRI